MGRVRVSLMVALCAPLSCTVPALDSAGRPCSSSEPCGPGTVCHPTTRTCVTGGQLPGDRGSEATGPGDRSLGEPPGLQDLRPADQTKVDARRTDSQHPDLQLCAGLTCPLGCNLSANRCLRVKPSSFSASGFFEVVTAHVNVSGTDASIDPSTGLLRSSGTSVLRPAGSPGTVVNGVYWGVVSQGPGSPAIGVFGIASLTIPSGALLKVTPGSYALAIYSTGPVAISGTLKAAASYGDGGAGGYAGGQPNGGNGVTCGGGEGKGGAKEIISSVQYDTGGGGGGHKAAGGQGGKSSTATVPAGAGGGVTGSALLSPLAGGCGGGGGGGPDMYTGKPGDGGGGGGGGGAIQITANAPISVGGVITVPGWGGEGGHYGAAGGGGGAGGAILLEAISISVPGILAANGGGGGAGTVSPTDASAPAGSEGTSTTAQASGGTGSGYGGSGGKGGARAAEAGGAGGNDTEGGGGGGAAGRIHCVSVTPPIVGASNASPAPTLAGGLGSW